MSGQGDFEGTYKLIQGGFELKGPFRSDVAGVNQWRFPDLQGHVRWLPRGRLEVTKATSRFMGGTAQFDYVLGPTKPKTPETRVDVAYRDVNIVAADGLPRVERPSVRGGRSAAGTDSNGGSGSGRKNVAAARSTPRRRQA